MKCTDTYNAFRRIVALEESELRAALKAHGGSFSWEDDSADGYDRPIVIFNPEHPIDFEVTSAWLDEREGIHFKGFDVENGEEYEDVGAYEIEFSHISYITGEIPATDAVSDVSNHEMISEIGENLFE